MNIGNDVTGFILTDVGVAAESIQTENVGEGMFPVRVGICSRPALCTKQFLYVYPEGVGDDLLDTGGNMGEEPSSSPRSLSCKLPLVITKGRTRPDSVLIAAKFATKCNEVVRKHVPVRSHCKRYKGDTELLSGFCNNVAVSTYYRPVMFIQKLLNF